MAWSNQSNKEYQTKAYKRARAYVVQRDMGLCFRCEHMGRIVPFDAVDHFTPLHRMTKAKHDVKEMWCLCKSCHDEKTHLESQGKDYPFKPRINPYTGYDYDETNWLALIAERTNGKRKNDD